MSSPQTSGSSWQDAFPGELLADAKKALALLRRRSFLRAENADNLVWALTVEQLRIVLTDSALSPFVFDLTGLAPSDVSAELEALREIRNIVAHNRATNEVALENLGLVEHRLSEGIRLFKSQLIYSRCSVSA